MSVDASDPHADSTGKLSTRDSKSEAFGVSLPLSSVGLRKYVHHLPTCDAGGNHDRATNNEPLIPCSCGLADLLTIPAGKDEFCICAAIKLDDGRVIRGHRHDDCIQTAIKWREAGQDVGQMRMEAQGFVTSQNRFVDRVEGMRLQVAAGLFKARPGAQILMSEDLY